MLVAQDGINPSEMDSTLASMGVEADPTEQHGGASVNMPPPQPPVTPAGSEFKYTMKTGLRKAEGS